MQTLSMTKLVGGPLDGALELVNFSQPYVVYPLHEGQRCRLGQVIDDGVVYEQHSSGHYIFAKLLSEDKS